MKFTEFANRVKNIDILQLQQVVAENNAKYAADLNRDQLINGETYLGDDISPEYRSYNYAIEKNQLNSKPGLFTPDLKLTGSFHDSIIFEPFYMGGIAVGGEFSASDGKAPMLLSKYSNVLGLNEVNLRKLIARNNINLVGLWLMKSGLRTSFTMSTV